MAIVGNYDVNAEIAKKIWDDVIGYKEGISLSLTSYLQSINPQQIALNYSEENVIADGLSHGLYLKLQAILPKFRDRFISAERIVERLRGRKTATEIALINYACKLTTKINEDVTAILQPGMSETEVQEKFHLKMANIGVTEAWQKESCPMIDAGPNKELGHSGPLAHEITKKNHTLHNDFGIRYHGYCSDIQRMWYFGAENSLPEELRHAFDTVKNAIRKAAAFLKPGVKGYEVDQIARSYVVERGYEEYGHALGHQVGIAAHDGGTLLGPLWERYGAISEGIIEENNIFTLELGVNTIHYGTVSLEEMVKVTAHGCEFLIPPQEDFIFLP